jgi:hypothetical protein
MGLELTLGWKLTLGP